MADMLWAADGLRLMLFAGMTSSTGRFSMTGISR